MKKAVGDTIYSRVCDSLRDGILSGELGPGQRLKMTDLVARYGISPMPIREALQKLQGEGLITIEPHRGAKVRQVDREFVGMVHELRTAIECMLGRKAAANISDKAVAELERLQKEYDRAAEEGNAAKVVSANLKFHALIYSFGNNPLALEILNNQSSLIRGIRTKYGYCDGRTQQVSLEHRQIIQALRAHDADAVESHLRRHCNRAGEEFMQLLQEKNNISDKP
jgi:DNA-binding GntR family transcriptional regulator